MSDEKFDDLMRDAAQHYNRPPDVPPRLVLADALPDAPELEAGLKALLADGLKRAGDAGETWRARWALQLVPAARRQLWERTQSEPLEVTVRVEVPGKAAAEANLRLLCQEDVFKGLIAIDFGTSNSTVTLYDPGVVEDLTGLAPEQETRLVQAHRARDREDRLVARRGDGAPDCAEVRMREVCMRHDVPGRAGERFRREVGPETIGGEHRLQAQFGGRLLAHLEPCGRHDGDPRARGRADAFADCDQRGINDFQADDRHQRTCRFRSNRLSR